MTDARGGVRLCKKLRIAVHVAMCAKKSGVIAAWCVLAVGLVKGLMATSRDADQAYCDGSKETLILIELPRDWWLASRVDTEGEPNFRRPAVVMKFAFPGHPNLARRSLESCCESDG